MCQLKDNHRSHTHISGDFVYKIEFSILVWFGCLMQYCAYCKLEIFRVT